MKKTIATLVEFLAVAMLMCGVAFSEISILNTFTSGELSPHLDARIDFEKYSSGCRTLENFIVLPYGGALKRPGTQYIGETKNGGVARLAPFSVGVDQTYIMELGAGYIRFYRDGIQVPDTNSVPLEVVTPYGADDVFSIQFAQFADTVYMVHPDHPVQKLQRTTTAPTFEIEEVEWSWPPVLDENLTDTTISASSTTGAVTLTASEALFTTNHVGSSWVLRTTNDDNKRTVGGTETSDPIKVEGDWNLRTGELGANADLVTIQVSEDNGNTWGDFREYGYSGTPIRYDRDGEETEFGILYRVVTVGITGNTYFTVEEPYINGYVTITNYISSTEVEGYVGSTLGSTNATDIWFEGAFSDERGYPRTVEFYENRLWFGGTDYLVNTLWGSKTDDYENFQTGTFDDSSLRLSINSDNIIEWLLGRTQLFVGTLGDEWVLSGGDTLTPVTPTSVLARRQTSFGSKDGIDALIASDSIMYLQRQGRKLREFEYSLEADAYKSTDVTLLAEHITEGNIIQIAEQQQPEPIVWAVRGDGELIGMTYNKIQNVYGWHRHVTDGDFESVAVIPTTGEDRVYVVVNRNGGRYIEWFRPFDWGDDDDAWFVDSGLDFDGGETLSNGVLTTDSNGVVTVTVANTFSTNDHVKIEDSVYSVYSSTPSNFVLGVAGETNQTLFTVSEINIENASSNLVNGTYNSSGYKANRQIFNKDSSLYVMFWEEVFPGVEGLWYIQDSQNDGRSTILHPSFGFPIPNPDYDSSVNVYYKNSSEGLIVPKANWYISNPAIADPLSIVYSTTSTSDVQQVQQTFTNVSHLAGETLNIFADGGSQPDATVSTNGVLTLSDYHNRVIAGLPYTALLSPMYIDVVSQQGISYGKHKTPYKVHFRVQESGAFNYGSNTNELKRVVVRENDLPVGEPVPFFSGDPTTKPIDTETKTNPEFWVTSEEPLPLEILSLTIFTDVKEYE